MSVPYNGLHDCISVYPYKQSRHKALNRIPVCSSLLDLDRGEMWWQFTLRPVILSLIQLSVGLADFIICFFNKKSWSKQKSKDVRSKNLFIYFDVCMKRNKTVTRRHNKILKCHPKVQVFLPLFFLQPLIKTASCFNLYFPLFCKPVLPIWFFCLCVFLTEIVAWLRFTSVNNISMGAENKCWYNIVKHPTGKIMQNLQLPLGKRGLGWTLLALL